MNEIKTKTSYLFSNYAPKFQKKQGLKPSGTRDLSGNIEKIAICMSSAVKCRARSACMTEVIFGPIKSKVASLVDPVDVNKLV